MEELVRLHPASTPPGTFPLTTAAAGEEVLTQGAASDGMILLLSGLLRAEYSAEGAPRLVARSARARWSARSASTPACRAPPASSRRRPASSYA